MPEKVIENLKKNIAYEQKICFLWAMIMGVIAHLYKITNWLPNWDSLVFRYDGQNMLAMGRWFLPVACGFGSFYDLPFVAGFMAIIFHALGGCIIAKMLEVKKAVTAGMIGALVATFPTVSSVMMYNYVADGYALAFLMSCLAAYLITKEKPRYVLGSLLIALSCGIYQAYITVTIMLILIWMIFSLLYKNGEVKDLVIKAVKLFLAGGAGMGLYYLAFFGLLEITNTQMLEYQGFETAATFGGVNILGAIWTIKESFLSYFVDFSAGINAYSIINCLVVILTAVLYVADVARARLSWGKILMLGALVVAMPIGANVLVFINSTLDYHNLMKMGYLVFYLFLILRYEKGEPMSEKLDSAKAWAILGTVSVLVFNYVLIANISYHKLSMAYEKSYGTLVRIADRIEQTDGADECSEILVLGELADSEAYSSKLPPDMTGTTDGVIIRADDEMVGQSVLSSALCDYCGKDYDFLAGKEKKDLMETDEVEKMGLWPDKDSIKVVDGVIVIKLSDDQGETE